MPVSPTCAWLAMTAISGVAFPITSMRHGKEAPCRRQVVPPHLPPSCKKNQRATCQDPCSEPTFAGVQALMCPPGKATASPSCLLCIHTQGSRGCWAPRGSFCCQMGNLQPLWVLFYKGFVFKPLKILNFNCLLACMGAEGEQVGCKNRWW